MKCPLCNSPMARAYRTLNRPEETAIVGYTDVFFCSRTRNSTCYGTMDIVVRDNEAMHDCISGADYLRAMAGEA